MAFIYLGHPKRITDLGPHLALRQLKDDNSVRMSVRMIIIDDEPFPYTDELRHHGYNIEQFHDLETLDSLSAYDVVLCDVKGVGTKFNPELQGAYLVKEIRKRFPFKIIISYTAYESDARYTELLMNADFSIRKGETIKVWSEKLDSAVSSVCNIEERWAKTRDYLLNSKVPIFQVALLESDIVSRIQKKKGFENFPIINKSFSLEKSARDILLSFIGSAAVKLLLG